MQPALQPGSAGPAWAEAAVVGLGLDAWWDEPEYNTCNTFHLRSPFIFGGVWQ
jgi:hypothetical protein